MGREAARDEVRDTDNYSGILLLVNSETDGLPTEKARSASRLAQHPFGPGRGEWRWRCLSTDGVCLSDVAVVHHRHGSLGRRPACVSLKRTTGEQSTHCELVDPSGTQFYLAGSARTRGQCSYFLNK